MFVRRFDVADILIIKNRGHYSLVVDLFVSKYSSAQSLSGSAQGSLG